MVVKLTVDGQLPEDSVTRAWDADLQEAGMLDRTRRVSRLLAKTRRDESANTSGAADTRCGRLRPSMRKRAMGEPEIDGYASRLTFHSRRSSSPHRRERARKSTLAGQSTFAATRDLAVFCLSMARIGRLAGLDGDREQPAQSGRSSRGSHAPPRRRQHRSQGEGPQVTSFKRGGVQRW